VNNATITPLGDTLLTVALGDGVSEELSRRVVAQAAAITGAGIIGVTDVVPAYAAIGVHFDPLVIAFDDLRDRLMPLALEDTATDDAKADPRHHSIRVSYSGEDLDEVAARTGLNRDDVIEMHASAEYRVFVLGFVPGFAYLGQIDERLALPRRTTPRQRVPAGSVAIADRQTAIYPSVTPGGWHLIGTTDVRLFDPAQDRPSLFRVGDSVRFVPG
jgi:KipI family sensor histidine kinase inhibitor